MVEAIEEGVRAARRQRIDRLPAAERGWRLSPLDGGDPNEVSEHALRREVRLELQARQQLGSAAGVPGAVERHVRELKHFPILLVSAPHIEDAVSGTFPGTPTPLLHATALLDRLLRIDEFPRDRVPEVVAVMNPPLYTPEFRAELERIVHERRPRLVGISNLSEGHHFALEIARIVKRTRADTIVLMGGQHEDGTNPIVYRRTAQRAGSMPLQRGRLYDLDESALERVARTQTLGTSEERMLVDLVAAGDCPYLLLELLLLLSDDPDIGVEGFKRRIRGAADRFAALPGSGFLFFHDADRDQLDHVELSGAPIEGDLLPYIDVSRITHENRFPVFGNRLTAQVMACLGCKYSCAFCHESADHLLYGIPKLLQRSAEHVMGELRLRWEQGFEAVFFDDSTFTQDHRWLDTFLLSMQEEADRPGGFLEWGCQTTINDLTPRVVDRLAAAGCTYVYFGVESANPALAMVQKARMSARAADAWLARFERVARWCREAGVRVGTSLQFGLGESAEDRIRTLDAVAALHHEGCIADGCVALNVNAPYPGTEQWVGLLHEDDEQLPDYRARLVRHPAFETAHQFTQIGGAELEDVYLQAADRLGDAILSVDFAAHAEWRRLVVAAADAR